MVHSISIKNRIDWISGIILTIGLLILIPIILIFLPFFTVRSTIFLSVLDYFTTSIPAIGMFILCLYFWLWNFFGRTDLFIDSETLVIKYKRRLFFKQKSFQTKEIKEFKIWNLSVEKSLFHIRRNYLFTNHYYAICFVTTRAKSIVVFKWLSEKKAMNILKEIQKILQQTDCVPQHK